MTSNHLVIHDSQIDTITNTTSESVTCSLQLLHSGIEPSTKLAYRARERAVKEILDNGFPYSRKLSAHTSCVNALTFSSDGRWLASAGDDPLVMLWNFHQDDLQQPSCGFIGHKANVFALAFSASNHYLYSGDTDKTIYKYDVTRWSSNLTTPGRPISSYHRHRDSVRSLSSHPANDDILLSASEDGRILLHDSRVTSTNRAQGTLETKFELTSVQFHPVMHDLFVTGDARGDVCLKDARMAFDTSVKSKGTVQMYCTSLSKQGVDHLYRTEIGSVTFDKNGRNLNILQHYLPTIYALTDPLPLATCSGRNLPDGTPVSPNQRTYANSCTIKHGSFGGPGLSTDEYYSAGSDDFRGYIWKIPDLETLRLNRERVSAKQWNDAPTGDKRVGESLLFSSDAAFQCELFGNWITGFTPQMSCTRSVPVELSTPVCRLTGHRSIVNTTLFHPQWPLIVTSGIERHILLHSPLPSSPCTESLPLTSQAVRELPEDNPEDRVRFIHALAYGRLDGEDEDDKETIALFDQIIRNEGQADVFQVGNKYDPDDDDDSDEEIEARRNLMGQVPASDSDSESDYDQRPWSQDDLPM
ncbi:WD40-repeat-containing domain protein [Abortiporus biennis]|nr:WD40-repeat-containing domain protein [Abortiporus biennis]